MSNHSNFSFSIKIPGFIISTFFLIVINFFDAPDIFCRNLHPSSDVSTIPTILELSIFSSNLCNSAYAIDNDLIICCFTTMKPCFLTPPPAHDPTTASQPQTVSHAPDTSYILCNPQHDFRHWFCIYRIQNGEVPDQTLITAQAVLDQIFREGYRYYGRNPSVRYFAPIQYSVSYPAPANHDLMADSAFQITIRSNHPLEFLTPEIYRTESAAFWTVSVIDAAGNGPCCIMIPLEDADILLYNFKNVKDNCYIFSSDTK